MRRLRLFLFFLILCPSAYANTYFESLASIDSDELNIVASQDVNTSKNSSDHKHLNLSVGTSGATSGSVSLDRSKGSSDGITSSNSQLSANNININTKETTTIAGANIAANDELNITTEHLNVSSVQDSQNSRSQSSGFSVSGGTEGISGAGVNASNSRSSSRETVLTTLTGNRVNIDVEKDTVLKGALIAAVDSEGNDNGNLNLTTETLEVSSLNNRRDSKSMSMDVGVGTTVSLDYANDRSNSKTKTLGTLGEGNVDVANVDDSNTKMLNRDINDNEVDIYNVESHKGLKGSLDTRLLTEQGRDQIAEDIMKSGMIVDTVRQIATDPTVGIEDFFSETDKSNKTYEAVKKKIAEDPAVAAKLKDPNLNPEQKEDMLNSLTDAVLVELGYKDLPHENVIVAEGDDPRAGHYQNGKAYINDQNIYDTEGLVITAGHEASHAMDAQGEKQYADGEREDYATNYGENLADYTDMALDINGYDSGMASNNTHTGNSSDYVAANTTEYNSLDKSQGDDFLTLAGRDLKLQVGSIDIDPLDAKHGFNVVGAKKASEFSKADIEKFGEPIDLGNGEVGYILERLEIKGKLVPVVNGKMINDSGEWVDAPGGNASLEEYKNQQSKPNLDDMTTLRSYPDDKEKEAKVLESFIPTSIAESPDYPSVLQSAGCAAGENRCSSESLPNSNTGARKDFEVSGNTPITYEELEKKKHNEEGSYFPGMLPEDRLPEQSGRNR